MTDKHKLRIAALVQIKDRLTISERNFVSSLAHLAATEPRRFLTSKQIIFLESILLEHRETVIAMLFEPTSFPPPFTSRKPA